MVKVFCDFCGKEIGVSIYHPTLDFHIPKIIKEDFPLETEEIQLKAELCNECAEQAIEVLSLLGARFSNERE